MPHCYITACERESMVRLFDDGRLKRYRPEVIQPSLFVELLASQPGLAIVIADVAQVDCKIWTEGDCDGEGPLGCEL